MDCVHVFLIEGRKLTLIDSGAHSEEAWELLTRELAALGYAWKDVTKVLLTHGHSDHCGMAGRIQAAGGMPILAHPQVVPMLGTPVEYWKRTRANILGFIARMGATPEELHRAKLTLAAFDAVETPATQVDLLHDGATVEAGDDMWRILYVPGHSPSDTAFFRERDGLLIGGDALIMGINNVGVCEVQENWERTRNMLFYPKSLQRLYDLPVTCVLAGHGEPFTDHRAAVQSRLGGAEYWKRQTLEVLKEGPVTPMEICRRVGTRMRLPATLWHGLGACDQLEAAGEVVWSETDGIVSYRLVKESSNHV